MSLRLLACANVACSAISVAIAYFACRDWPARAASHTPSYSVVLFFLFFIAISIVCLIATRLYARTRSEVLLRLAAGPAILLGIGFGLGLLKAVLTGDF
jgi:hypothetical protein